jgi:hypothetical protein
MADRFLAHAFLEIGAGGGAAGNRAGGGIFRFWDVLPVFSGAFENRRLGAAFVGDEALLLRLGMRFRRRMLFPPRRFGLRGRFGLCLERMSFRLAFGSLPFLGSAARFGGRTSAPWLLGLAPFGGSFCARRTSRRFLAGFRRRSLFAADASFVMPFFWNIGPTFGTVLGFFPARGFPRLA